MLGVRQWIHHREAQPGEPRRTNRHKKRLTALETACKVAQSSRDKVITGQYASHHASIYHAGRSNRQVAAGHQLE